MKSSRRSFPGFGSKFTGCLLLLLSGFGCWSARAGPTAKAAPKLEALCLALEPQVLHTKVSQPLPDCKGTVLSPARQTVDGLKILNETEWQALGLPWPEFLKQALAAASRHFATLTPKIVKDSRGIVEYIKLEDSSHLTSSVLLCPELYATFSKSLGSPILAVVPDRFTIYLFPRATGAFVKHGKEMASLFAEATYPASDEAFEITETSLKSIGTFTTSE